VKRTTKVSQASIRDSSYRIVIRTRCPSHYCCMKGGEVACTDRVCHSLPCVYKDFEDLKSCVGQRFHGNGFSQSEIRQRSTHLALAIPTSAVISYNYHKQQRNSPFGKSNEAALKYISLGSDLRGSTVHGALAKGIRHFRIYQVRSTPQQLPAIPTNMETLTIYIC
jgi:hypothetical protein